MKLLKFICLSLICISTQAFPSDEVTKMMMDVVKAKLQPGETYVCTDMYCIIFPVDKSYKIGCMKRQGK